MKKNKFFLLTPPVSETATNLRLHFHGPSTKSDYVKGDGRKNCQTIKPKTKMNLYA